MEKTARRPSADPTQERLRANKAAWNKEVSAFINDLIHFKKLMNGWPSKFFKERSRITQPLPADPATIIGSLAGDFQEIATRGNGIIQEQVNYAKNRRQKQPRPAAPAPGQAPAGPATPEAAPAPEAPKPDLSQQIGKGLAASEEDSALVKLAYELEDKYSLEAQASNPFSRFITKLFTPKIGFGEAARIRRLRMTMLDSCVKAYKELKKLHKEIVKSSKGSIGSAHHMMGVVYNYWNVVNRLFYTYRSIRPGEVKDPGGMIENVEMQAEKAAEKGLEKEQKATVSREVEEQKSSILVNLVRDFNTASNSLGSVTNPAFHEMQSMVEGILVAPSGSKAEMMLKSPIAETYSKALKDTNAELGTSGTTFQEIANQVGMQETNPPEATKQAQLGRGLSRMRHQLLPGATSGQRLEIYNLITQTKKDLNEVMDLLEGGFDQNKLTVAVNQVNRGMTTLRTMIRALHHFETPEKSPSPFF